MDEQPPGPRYPNWIAQAPTPLGSKTARLIASITTPATHVLRVVATDLLKSALPVSRNGKRRGTRGVLAPIGFHRAFLPGHLLIATDGFFTRGGAAMLCVVVAGGDLHAAAQRLVTSVQLPRGDFADDVGVVLVREGVATPGAPGGQLAAVVALTAAAKRSSASSTALTSPRSWRSSGLLAPWRSA